MVKLTDLLPLNELGDLQNIEPFKLNKLKDEYYFKIRNGVQVYIKFKYYENLGIQKLIVDDGGVFDNTFDPDTDNIYNLGFTVNGSDTQFMKADQGLLFRVMKTLHLALEDFIKFNRPFGILLLGIDKGGELKSDKQKNLLYYMIAKNNTPQGYTLKNLECYLSNVKLDGYILYEK